MRRDFDPDDYALVAKLRANPPNPWKWEIYCAGKRLPIEQSSTYFDSRGSAQAAGKKAHRAAGEIERLSYRTQFILKTVRTSAVTACLT